MKRTISTQKLSISYERTTVLESDDDPTPSSYPALRVVTADGYDVSESIRPLVKSRHTKTSGHYFPWAKKVAR